MEQPRIGVWICDCMGLISDHVDTARLAERAGSLDHVALVKKVPVLCGAAALAEFADELEANRINRVLFAGCSPRSSLKFPEEQLTAAMATVGLDRAFIEVANLREQCAWLHQDNDQATRKGIDLLAMAHARLRSAAATLDAVSIVPKALVIGGGAAGLQAAKAMAAAGQEVTLVEKDSYLGGRLCQIGFLFQCESWPAYCRSECVGPVQAMDAILDPRITALTRSEVMGITKMSGNFQARIKRGAPFVDPDRCISCKQCAEVCPEETDSGYNLGLYRRKAIDKEFERAVPDTYTIIDEACTRCGDCLPVCPTEAINLEARPDLYDDTFGAVFLATGFEHLDLSTYQKFGLQAPNVVTGIQFERLLDHGLKRPSDDEVPERVVFVLCAGSRATPGRDGVPYCSKTCCSTTVKHAERIAAMYPETEVVIIYNHDIRTYERALEAFYTRVQGTAEFVNGEIETISEADDGLLKVRLALAAGEEPDLDDAEADDDSLILDSDLVVLAAAQTPRSGIQPLLDQLGVISDRHGFPRETQVRLFRPTETVVDRVFSIGGGAGPKVVQQAVEQASAAAMKALPVLLSGTRETAKFASVIAEENCIRCHSCLTVCPHGAIRMTAEGAVSDPAFCQACGFCAAACPTHAAQLLNFSDRQILDQAAVAFAELPAGQPKVLALLCYWCSYSGGDLAGIKGMKAPANFRSIRIRCSSSVNSGLVMEFFRMGIDGVLVAGCPEKSCHHLWGNYLADRRVTLMRNLFGELGLSPKRLRFEYIGVPQGKKLIDTIEQMNRDIEALGSNPIPTTGRN